MKINEFVKDFEERLANFQENLKDHKPQSEYDWMEMFLRWCEWSDDEMREQYWSKDI